MSRLMVLGLLVLAAATTAAAQEGSCFRGRPLPDCRNFWVTDASYSVRLELRPRPLDEYMPGEQFLPSVEFGGMRNLNRKVAVGASIGAGLLGGVYLTAKPRVRYWASPSVAVDLAPGLLLTGQPGGASRFMMDASIMFGDRIGITAQSFVLPVTVAPPSGPITSRKNLVTYLGVRLGSELGVAGAAGNALAFLGLIGAYIIACSGGGGCD